MIALAECTAAGVTVHVEHPEGPRYATTIQLQPLAVCAWCWPMQEDFFRAHPEHRGRALTHTICQEHKRQVLAGVWKAVGR